jgi:Signal transduction histidine kinase
MSAWLASGGLGERGPARTTAAWERELAAGFPVVSDGHRAGTVRGVKTSRLSLLAIAILVASGVVGGAAFAVGRVDPGFTFGYSHDDAGGQTLVVASVQPGGLAWFEGLQPGSIVLNVEGSPTVPGDVSAQHAAAASPPQGMIYVVAPAQLKQALSQGDLGSPVQLVYLLWAGRRLMASWTALLAAALLCVASLVWLRSRRGAGRALRGTEAPLLASAASALFLLPAYLTLSPLLVVLTSCLVAAGALVAAAAFAQLADTPRVRRLVLLGSTVLAVAAAIVGAMAAANGMERSLTSESRWALASAVPLLPALVVAQRLRLGTGSPGSPSRLAAVMRSGDVAVIATLLAVTLAPLAVLTNDPFLQPLLVWIGVVAITRGLAVRPIALVAGREARERELVVDAGESERARIAADIHDDVIQDLSMLVHRLDRAGADDAAATVRHAIDRLRAICADLRLPVLDDLGLAVALRALVGEVRASSGQEIDLQCDGDHRPPYDVELGLYRIAQEAVANALKHGRPPIVVRLRAQAGRAELDVDDSGTGVGENVLARPAGPGHLGFLNMMQRAGKLGAELAISDRPEGGTRVRVVWDGHAASTATGGPQGAAT